MRRVHYLRGSQPAGIVIVWKCVYTGLKYGRDSVQRRPPSFFQRLSPGEVSTVPLMVSPGEKNQGKFLRSFTTVLTPCPFPFHSFATLRRLWIRETRFSSRVFRFNVDYPCASFYLNERPWIVNTSNLPRKQMHSPSLSLKCWKAVCQFSVLSSLRKAGESWKTFGELEKIKKMFLLLRREIWYKDIGKINRSNEKSIQRY